MKLKYQALSLHYALSIMSEGGGRRTKMLVLLDYSVNDCHVYLRMQNIVFQRGTVNLILDWVYTAKLPSPSRQI